jgi:hypothetical protein
MKTTTRRGRPKKSTGLYDWVRLTIRLPRERAKVLKAYSAINSLDLGQVVDRGLDHAMGGFYFAHRPNRSPAAEGAAPVTLAAEFEAIQSAN